MTSFLDISRAGAVVTLRLNRPEEHNALSDRGQMQEFADFCADMRADQSVRAVILTGAGASFCAGGNVKHMHQRAGMFEGTPYVLRNGYRDGIQRIPLALYELEIPVIAAINGAAIGAGLDLACMCDIRLASETARFAESFVKLGIVPGDGGAWLLPRIIGLPRATLMAFTGDTIDSEQALAWGMITERLPADRLMPAAQALAERIAANPGPAMRMTKRLLREGQHMRLDSLLEMSAAFQALAHYTEEHGAAVESFVKMQAARTRNKP
jgi:enoyl-CoA hydratase/carnithine racemase